MVLIIGKYKDFCSVIMTGNKNPFLLEKEVYFCIDLLKLLL